MLDSYERGEVTPPPVSSYAGSPGLLALHSSLYATPTSRAFDIDSGIDGNESPMSMDTQIIPVYAYNHQHYSMSPLFPIYTHIYTLHNYRKWSLICLEPPLQESSSFARES